MNLANLLENYFLKQKKTLSFLLSFILAIFLFLPNYAFAACSPYIGQATLNEFFKDQANQSNDVDDFVEIKLLNDSIPASEYGTWKIKICEKSIPASNNDEDGCSNNNNYISLSNFTDTSKPWITLMHQGPYFIGQYINLKSGFDAVLVDSNNDLIDYISVDGYSDAITSVACNLNNLIFDYTASSPGVSDKTIFRSPDGTGNWDSAASATAPPTDGATNDNLPTPPIGETYPIVTINDIQVSPGGTGLFTISLVDTIGNPKTFSQSIAVNYFTQDGTATVADSDYTAIASSILTIPAGQTSATITVDATSSDNNDVNEYFYLVLDAVQNSTANGDTPNATISKHFGSATLNGPIGEWRFDVCTPSAAGDITDSSGNGYNGTPNNGISTAIGRICTAGSFDGSNDYVSLPGLPNLTSSFTISAWIKPNAINADQRIFADDENNSNGFAFSLGDGDDGRLRLFSRGVNPISIDSSAAITTGSWHHVVAVHDSANKTRQIFVNGVDVTNGPQTYTGTWGSDSGLASIGGETDGAGSEANDNWRFNGLIDEVRVYTRALSATEINSYYTNPDPSSRICPTCVIPVSQTIILSTENTETLGGLTFSDGSLAEYDPITTNASLYFNENLFSGGADIDALHVLANGIIILSTTATETLGGLTFNSDDLIAYNPSTNSATLYFDGDALFSNTNEDIDAVYVRDNGNIILSTTGSATLGGITFTDGSLVEYTPSTNSATLFFNENTFSGDANIDGVHMLSNGNILISTDGTETLGGLSFSDGSIVEYVPGTNAATLYFNENQFSGGADIDALTLPPIATSFHHIEFIHDGSAITCNPEPIIIKACANADCTTLATSIDVSLSPTNASSTAITWSDSDAKTFTTGIENLTLQNTVAGIITLDTDSTSPAAPNPVVCKDSIGAVISCDIVYSDSGFIFDVGTQNSCVTSPNIKISAVRKSPTTEQCIPFFDGKSAPLKFWATYAVPNSGTKKATLNYNAVDYPLDTATTDTGTDITMTFDNNGEASFTLNYADAGQLDLRASYTGSASSIKPDVGLSMSGNKLYVTKPAKLYVYSDDLNASCISNNGTCSAFKTAGNDINSQFNLKIRAACDDADNTVTPNFSLNNIDITYTNTSPAVNQGNIAVTSFDMAASDSGEHIISTQSVSEVGAFTFTATSPNYLGVTGPSGTSTYIGRFYPHHFDTTVAQGCDTFTYSGQEFIVTTTAQNNWLPTPTATQNYTNTFAFETTLSNGAITPIINFYDANKTPTDTNIISAASFSNGTAVKSDVTYTFPSKDTPQATITLRANDIDTGSAAGIVEGSTEIRSGRAKLENVFGSELTPLTVPLVMQYYSDNATPTDLTDDSFVTNVNDSCSTYDAPNGTLANYTDNLSSGEIAVTGTAIVSSGIGNIIFHKPLDTTAGPGVGNEGSVNLLLDNLSSWLTYSWGIDCDNADGDNDTTTGVDSGACSTASFGLYRGDDRIIYWREVFK